MNTKTILATIAAAALGFTAQATTYPGNLNTGFGGAIGLGSLTLTDNGTIISGTLTKGVAGNFDNALVLYIDSTAGGFANTSGFADGADGLRKAISGFDGGVNRSLMQFSGMSPDYAIGLSPSASSFGGLWGLANGGANSLNFITSVGLTPTGTATSATYTFSFNLADIGLTPGAGQTFSLFGTYVSESGFRSTEALPGNDAGTQGWNPFLQTAFATYTTTPIPEPATLTLMGLSGLATLVAARRRK